jgi:hypothetical protein
MKALWFLPFAFAGGAEGFALFAPYLIGVLCVLYVVRTLRARAAQPKHSKSGATSGAAASADGISLVQPAL